MNSLNIQLICFVAFTFFIVCFRILGVSFKVFSVAMLVIIVVWGLAALVALFGFAKLSLSGQLASLSVGATVASVLALCFLAWLGLTVFQGSRVPPIHNISTDTVNPPDFEKISAHRAATHNPLSYTAQIAEQQRQHYGYIEPLQLAASKDEVFEASLRAVDKLGWQLQYQNSKANVIEASDTSGIFGFVDDVVVRIRPDGRGSIVDLRSVSRVGKSDFGANAKRIQNFLTYLEADLGR